MNKLLEEILQNKSYRNSEGSDIKIHSETSYEQCVFLQEIIKKNNFNSSLEIGLAFGISSVAIAEAVKQNNGKHVVIDKFQNQYWNGIGLEILKKASLIDIVEFHEDFSYFVLSKLVVEKAHSFDFAYLDTTKLFDWLLVDFFLLDKLIKVGGIIVFDDVSFPAIRKLLRYISQLPHYEVYDVFPFNNKIRSRKKILNIFKYFPKNKYFLRPEIIKNDFQLNINSHCIALRKISEDKREYDWHIDF